MTIHVDITDIILIKFGPHLHFHTTPPKKARDIMLYPPKKLRSSVRPSVRLSVRLSVRQRFVSGLYGRIPNHYFH